MSLDQMGITHHRLDDRLVASIVFRGLHKKYPEIVAQVQQLYKQCRGYIDGPPRAIFYFDSFLDGTIDIEVQIPVTKPIESSTIKSQIFRGRDVLSIALDGPYDDCLIPAARKLSDYVNDHGLPFGDTSVIFKEFDPNNPEKAKLEVQELLLPWYDLLAENLRRTLGDAAVQTVMQGSDQLTIESSMDERVAWLKTAMDHLDERADDFQKYDILSSCAHLIPQSAVDYARAIYEQTHDIDALLQAMLAHKWFPKQMYREGNVIYIVKRPANAEEYAKAQTLTEKRYHCCYCSMVCHRMDSGVSQTFCNCSSGWYRRTWEGILGRPVRVEVIETVLGNGEACRFAVYLPEDL